MKVALVPLKYNELNYGGILQFYALQETIKSLGFDFDILNVEAEKLVCRPITPFETKMKRFVKKLVNPIMNTKQSNNRNSGESERIAVMNKFEEMFFGKFMKATDTDILSYDAIICGSDQIWNPVCARERTFLKFVPDAVNKVIYAASLGCDDLTLEQKKAYKPLVERINYVSVREISAKPLLESFVNRDDIEVVLDPTLLLTREEWELLSSHVEHKNYMLTYFLGESKGYENYLKDFAQKNNLTIINVCSENFYEQTEFGDINLNAASPQEFLGLIKNAEVIFTDSFHACVFSSVFNKKFYVFRRKHGESMMGRIETLFKKFQLPNRIIDVLSEISLEDEIDYSGFEQNRKALAEKSVTFLRKSVMNENE